MNKEYIKAHELNLQQWLEIIAVKPEEREVYVIDYQFPSDKMLDEYLSTIESRTEAEVKELISKFIFEGGRLGYDSDLLEWLLSHPMSEVDKMCAKSVFLKNLLRIGDPKGPWPNMHWILDLLPRFPQEAISAIDSYFLAHCMYFPDGRIYGIGDAKTLIRAKFINFKYPVQQVLLELTPRDFELLVAYLYKKKGYKVHVTKRSRDGGYDVLAERESEREHEILHIECKRYEQKIGVDIVRKALGTLSVSKATKAVVVTSSDFTGPARSEALQSKRAELISYATLDHEMKCHVDNLWGNRIDSYIMEMKKVIASNS
ncbi:restriction endonuclease [Vibrio parahaemolyticus]|uniref:restriction endonuclease n=1 Tax=Vibrio parahaemolyticus TaxID=670 RepID=UPI000446F811|nr:restriction endonuclease [Vibrio parahaemolyticus]EXJ27966.1 restriction endonuclease family protein [Vibrio parahaemolyticus VPCR-2009]